MDLNKIKDRAKTDYFMQMSYKAQALYLQLALFADDDNFVSYPEGVAKMLCVGQSELRELEEHSMIDANPMEIEIVTCDKKVTANG